MKKYNWDYGFERFEDKAEPAGSVFFDVHVGMGRPQRLYPETPAELAECRAQVSTCVNSLGSLSPEKRKVYTIKKFKIEAMKHHDREIVGISVEVTYTERAPNLFLIGNCGDAETRKYIMDDEQTVFWVEDGMAYRTQGEHPDWIVKECLAHAKKFRRQAEDRLRKGGLSALYKANQIMDNYGFFAIETI
jgi:hypothetical protein